LGRKVPVRYSSQERRKKGATFTKRGTRVLPLIFWRSEVTVRIGEVAFKGRKQNSLARAEHRQITELGSNPVQDSYDKEGRAGGRKTFFYPKRKKHENLGQLSLMTREKKGKGEV